MNRNLSLKALALAISITAVVTLGCTRNSTSSRVLSSTGLPRSLASTSGAQINAASCSQSDVQAAINSASAGDTVVLPACSVTWTTSTSLTPTVVINKAITLLGQTVCTGAAASLTCADQTIINDQTGTGYMEVPIEIESSGVRVSGLTMVGGQPGDTKAMIEVSAGFSGWRIDHCHFAPANTERAITTHGYGLVDHSYFKDTNNGVDIEGTQPGDNVPGDTSWSQPMSFGTADAVYIEDSEFNYSQVLDGAWDAYAGARLVFRHNDVNNTNYGGHGLDSGGLRSTMLVEIYNNTNTNSNTHIYTLMNTRGGSYIVFNNEVSGSGGSYDMFFYLQNYRSDPYCASSGECGNWGTCDGTNSLDQNIPGWNGWACRDQVGRGTNQQSYPQYSWNNTYKGHSVTLSDMPVCGFTYCTAAQTYHVLANRDFFNEVANFDGSSGVGQGLLSARPSTCTPKVAYWATDTKTLYQCSSPNTWTVYYQPYVYPHPLQGGASNPTPTPTPTPAPVTSGATPAPAGSTDVVTVTQSPSGNVTLSTAYLTINASASSSTGRVITGWHIYVDGVNVYGAGQTSSISTTLKFSRGTHTVVTRAWNSAGTYGSYSITVKR